MRNVKNMFDDEYQGMGPVSLDQLQEGEREKQRKLRQHLANQKRAKKVAEANLDVPQLTDSMVSESSPNMVEQRTENTRPELKSGMDRYMPYDAPPEPQSEVDVPMSIPDAPVPYEGVFGDRSLKGQRYGLGISNEGSLPYESPSKYQSLGLMGNDAESAKTEDYGLDLPELEKQKISSNLGRGSFGSDRQNSKDMLYDYLTNRRKSEPEFQQQYRNLSNEAETGRVLNTFASGLGEMASMAGTLGGKRADTGDMKALPNAIYGSMRKQADETLGLRRLENQEQVSDIKMLRDLEKGDLDNLRTQKIIADLHKQRNVPKTTQFYNEGDPEKGIAPSTMVIDSDGKFKEQALPMGTKSMANAYTLGQPLYTPEGKTIIPQVSRGGTIRYPEAPGMPAEGIRLKNQAEADKADLRLKEIDSERKTANDKEKQKLDREELNLKKAKDAWERNRDQQKIDLDESKSNNPRPGKDVAGETLDRTFSKDYEQYIAMGGKNALMQKLEILKNARDKLAKINPPPRAAGAFGESGIDLFAPEYAEIMADVRGAIQETLKQTLGTAFTEGEGERTLARSFNPRQTKEANLRNIDREIQNLVGRAKAKQAAVDYFEKNGTLRGFQSGSGDSGGAPKKQHNFKLNKTRFTYPDGRVEEKEGIL